MVPLVLGFPGRSHSYTAYLSEIHLTLWQLVLKLFLLGVSCWLVLALSQVAGTLIYRMSQGQVIDQAFIRSEFPLGSDFPPQSSGWLVSMISSLKGGDPGRVPAVL